MTTQGEENGKESVKSDWKGDERTWGVHHCTLQDQQEVSQKFGIMKTTAGTPSSTSNLHKPNSKLKTNLPAKFI